MIFAFQKVRLTICVLIAYYMLLSFSDNSIVEPVTFIDPLEGLADEGAISFKDPAIGQRSSFIFYVATYAPSTRNVDFKYESDTLVIAKVVCLFFRLPNPAGWNM